MLRKLLVLICIPFSAICQNTIGLPDIVHYAKTVYKAGLQNWDIKQDQDGVIYFANNEGLLSFDGKYWNNHPLPNKTIVRSVEIGSDGRIYVGGQDELGYFSPSANGRLQFFSLVDQIPTKERAFGDVWDIVDHKGSVFFRSSGKIFKFRDGRVEVFSASGEWAYLGACKGRLYAHDFKTGLLHFDHDLWMPVSGINALPSNSPVTGLIPANGDTVIITTLKSGLFYLANQKIEVLKTPNQTDFINHRIYGAAWVGEDRMALATNNHGVYITDFKGTIIQGFSRTEGLQNNNLLSIYSDRERNLWLGLDNGIDLVAYNSSIKQINPLSLDGSGYAACLHNNHLYLGTSNGLYSVALQQMEDLSFSKGQFIEINNSKGQTWGLAQINNQMLMGHHEGAFVIRDQTAIPISSEKGFWNFVPLSNTYPVGGILAGSYTGLKIFNFDQGRFHYMKDLEGFRESSRFVTLDGDSNIWVSHPYHGLYKITAAPDGTHRVFTYSNDQGLPSVLNNHIYKIKNELAVATEKGVFEYNKDHDRFEPSEYYHKFLGNQSIRYLREDNSGNIWFIHEKTLGVIDLSRKEPEIVLMPELSNKMLSGFELIYPVDESNMILGGEKGFYHINYAKYKQTAPPLVVQIRALRIISQTDSLLFGGYHDRDHPGQDADQIPSISYIWKTIRFEYASPVFGNQSNLEYSYRLSGYDNHWTEWSDRTEKEYTNLPAGTYRFEVKVRNNLGKESESASYSFKILPPWYKTTLAKVIYLLLIVAGLYFLVKQQEKKFKLQKLKYQEEQKKMQYIHDLELSKSASELVALSNEKLEADINYKNSELASSAMHLVKKGEFVSRLRTELAHVMKGLNDTRAEAEIKKIIKSISEYDNTDREWENFTIHFDKVHSDFISALKEKHPGVSNNEIKLCAYLRMNLTTKEIAQLMNISVRGVEVSRYRLRKKLELPTEVSLFDYLIGIQVKKKDQP